MVTEYNPVGHQPLALCCTCGAAVADPEAHTRWHEENR